MRILGFEIRRINEKKLSLHPDHNVTVQFAFELKGVKYYEFKNLLDAPTLRYKKVMEFIREAELSITSNELVELIKMSMDYLDKGNASKSIVIQNTILNLASQFMEADTFYRLFSCVFFTLEEDVTDYDYDYNEQKIVDFKSEKIPDFFLKEPIKRYLPQPNISEQDLNTFLRITKANRSHLQQIKSNYTNGQ